MKLSNAAIGLGVLASGLVFAARGLGGDAPIAYTSPPRYEYATLRVSSTSYPGVPQRDVEMLWVTPGRAVQVLDRVNEPTYNLSPKFFDSFCPGEPFATRTETDLISVVGRRGWRLHHDSTSETDVAAPGTGDLDSRKYSVRAREWVFERVQ